MTMTKMTTPNNETDEVVIAIDVAERESWTTILKVCIEHSRPIQELDDIRASMVHQLGEGVQLTVLESALYLNGHEVTCSKALC